MKKVITALFIFTFALPFTANAHTTLTESSPSEGEVITETLEEVQLDFGTSIEEASTMTLEGQEDSFEFESIAVEGQTMTGKINEELPNGPYVIQWKIIGADGHPIEGELPFALNIKSVDEEEPAEEPTEESAEEPTEEPTEESAEEPTEESAQEPDSGQGMSEEPAASETSAEADNDGGSLLGTILLIAAAILLVFGLYKLLSKKR